MAKRAREREGIEKEKEKLNRDISNRGVSIRKQEEKDKVKSKTLEKLKKKV